MASRRQSIDRVVPVRLLSLIGRFLIFLRNGQDLVPPDPLISGWGHACVHVVFKFQTVFLVVMESFSNEAKAEEDLVELVYQYISTKSYPPGCSESKKRIIRKKAKRFEVCDGELCYMKKVKGKVSNC